MNTTAPNKGGRPRGTTKAIKFEISGKFNAPRKTILSRIKADKLVVFNTGVSLSVLEIEPCLVVIVISAWECGYPLSVGECILVAKKLVEGTIFPKKMIKFKTKRNAYDPNAPLRVFC